MTQEEKDLVLQDLCARLPYGVMVQDDMGRTYKLNLGNAYLADLCYGNGGYIEAPIKPYLRPMLSMTEEEQKEFVKFHCVNICPIVIIEDLTISNEAEMFDWLNKKMFDFRGLIPKGHAIEVTEDNNPYKN